MLGANDVDCRNHNTRTAHHCCDSLARAGGRTRCGCGGPGARLAARQAGRERGGAEQHSTWRNKNMTSGPSTLRLGHWAGLPSPGVTRLICGHKGSAPVPSSLCFYLNSRPLWFGMSRLGWSEKASFSWKSAFIVRYRNGTLLSYCHRLFTLYTLNSLLRNQCVSSIV